MERGDNRTGCCQAERGDGSDCGTVAILPRESETARMSGNGGSRDLTSAALPSHAPVCNQCGKSPPPRKDGTPFPVKADGEPKLPRGWKLFHGESTCGECLAAQWQVGGVAVPIDCVIDDDGESKEQWGPFKLALHQAWSDMARLANWTIRQLFLADEPPLAGERKMPKWVPPYLYPEARKAFPKIATGTLCQMLQTVQSKYGEKRIESLLFNRCSVPSYSMQRMSVPIKSGTWKIGFPEDVPILEFRMGDTRWRVKLKVNKGSARAIAALRKVVAGEYQATALQIKPQGKWSGRGDGVQVRAAGGSFGKQLLQPMAVFTLFRPVAAAIGDETLSLSTANDCLLRVVSPGGRELRWKMNALRGRIVAAARWRRDLSDDKKAERRRPRRVTRMMRDREARVAARMNRALDSACHQIAASVVNFCLRNELGRVEYDGRKCGWMPSFPYSKLEMLLQSKAKEAGIKWVDVSQPAKAAGDKDNQVEDA